MSETFTFHAGSIPLLVSVPHDGRRIPDDIAARMTGAGRAIPDTDWHVAHLYEFAQDLGAAMIVAEYSRYVVDLNRPADDTALYEGQVATGLCPRETFAGDAIYADDKPIDVAVRVKRYWQPYHDRIAATLADFRKTHGRALLWDAHSIASRVPRLFDGDLPVLNIGTYDGQSCTASIADAVMNVAAQSPFDAVIDGRFKGGYITRCHGQPDAGVNAIQLELAQRAYMDEASGGFDEQKAGKLRDTLRRLLETFLRDTRLS